MRLLSQSPIIINDQLSRLLYDIFSCNTSIAKMDLITQLGQQYKAEFESKYDEIQKKGLEQFQRVQDTVQELQPALQNKQEEIVQLIQDTVSFLPLPFSNLFYCRAP